MTDRPGALSKGPEQLHSNSSVGCVGRALLSDGDTRRSWHLFEMVSLDGCPGFKGPDPQPVSMSVAKSRAWTFARSRNGDVLAETAPMY